MSFFTKAGNGRREGQTDRRTYTVIIVNNCGSHNLLRRRSHCHAIGYEHHDWPFVDDRGISAWIPVRSDAGRYVGHDLLPVNTICSRFVNFLVSRLNTNRIVTIESKYDILPHFECQNFIFLSKYDIRPHFECQNRILHVKIRYSASF